MAILNSCSVAEWWTAKKIYQRVKVVGGKKRYTTIAILQNGDEVHING